MSVTAVACGPCAVIILGKGRTGNGSGRGKTQTRQGAQAPGQKKAKRNREGGRVPGGKREGEALAWSEWAGRSRRQD